MQLNNNTDKFYIKELTEQNNILLNQMYYIKNELEKYYKTKEKHTLLNKENDINQLSLNLLSCIVEDLAENIKLRSLVMQQKVALQVESTNNLAVRLGKTLIEGVNSISSFIILPFKLGRIWKTFEQTVPPDTLGGKNFQNILNTYSSDGIEAVEKLLNSVTISPVMRANAYTELARQIMHSDPKQAALLARLAWETDPQPYRLKWMAFRVHEADDVITAEALLDMLPVDINMNKSEERHVARIHKESKFKRTQQAKKIIEKIQINTDLLLRKISALKVLNEENEKKYQNIVVKLNNKKEEIENLSKRLEEKNIALEKAQKDVELAYNRQILLQEQMKKQNIESDKLALRTALVLKNMLTQFDKNTTVLSQVMRIIMGSTEKN